MYVLKHTLARYVSDTSTQVIASRPKKRRTSRRASAKSSLVGSPASQKAATAIRAQAPNGKQAKADTAPHAEKIIVSNLPIDVNEAQIKVCILKTCIRAVV